MGVHAWIKACLQPDLLATERVQSPVAVIGIIDTAVWTRLIPATIRVRVILLVGRPAKKRKRRTNISEANRTDFNGSKAEQSSKLLGRASVVGHEELLQISHQEKRFQVPHHLPE